MSRVLRAVVLIAILFGGLWGATIAARADPKADAEYKRLSDEFDALYAARKLSETTATGRQLLQLSKKAYGPEHPKTLDAMLWLANILEAQALKEDGEAAQARRAPRPEFKAMREEAIALLMPRYAAFLKTKGMANDDVRVSRDRLVNLLRAAGRIADAEAILKGQLPTAGSAGTPPAPAAQDGPDAIPVLTAEAKAALDAGRPEAARDLAMRAVAIAERLATGNPAQAPIANALVAIARVYLGEAERALGRYSAALAQYELIIPLAQLLPEPVAALAYNNMGTLYEKRGDFANAETRLLFAVAMFAQSPGAKSDEYAVAISNLAGFYSTVGRFDEAEKIYGLVIAARRDAGPAAAGKLSLAMANMASVIYRRHDGRLAEARDWTERALALAEKAFPQGSPDLAQTRAQLAALLSETGDARDLDRAESLARQAIGVLETRGPKLLSDYLAGRLGPPHPDLAAVRITLATILEKRGKIDPARKLIEEAIAATASASGNDHPDTVLMRTNLARHLVQNGRAKEALQPLREAVRGATGRSRSFALDVLKRPPTGRIAGDAEQIAFWMPMLAKIAHRAHGPEGVAADGAMRDAFAAAQWAAPTAASAALAEMAARGGSGSPELAALVRERQDAVTAWQTLDEQRAELFALPPGDGSRLAEKAAAEKRAAIEKHIASIDERLRKEHPKYGALTAPEALRVEDVQRLLKPDEALVLIMPTVALKPMPEETFVWVVTKTAFRAVRVEAGVSALADGVAALRCGLDAAAWRNEGAGRCSSLTHLAKRPPLDRLPFSPGIAHDLYEALFGKVRPLIADKKHLLLVPMGPLTSLPFHVLVTKEPDAAAIAKRDYRDVAWLAREHAITVLPAVASLKALRENDKSSAASQMFIGFGNPSLVSENSGYDPGDTCATVKVYMLLGAAGADPARVLGAGANIAEVRKLEPVPETGLLLCNIVERLGLPESEIHLGAKARELTVKQLSAAGTLSRYRYVHFATHGLVAGELGLGQPAIVLTPPAKNADPKTFADDDGVLTASEVATLKLDADWVILSACNTASGKTVGAEALSGLARAFFYAGARALLVSHWSVRADAAGPIATRAFDALRSNPKLGRAEALQSAMLAVAQSSLEASHPTYWAPFSVIGEGGAKP